MKKIAFMSLLGFMPSFAADQVVVSNTTTPVVVEEETPSTVGQHGFYYALGLLLCNSGERVDFYQTTGARVTESNGFGTRLGGTLALGYQFMPQGQPYCAGLEIGSDFSPRHEEIQSHKSDPHESSTAPGMNRMYDLRTTRNGFRPFVAIRGGYVNYDHKFMVYVKAGMSYADSKEHYTGYTVSGTGAVTVDRGPITIKCSCWTPLVALGVEKSFTNNFTLRGEAEYKFARTKDHAYSDGTWVKFTQKGAINVRVLFCHNIRIGQ